MIPSGSPDGVEVRARAVPDLIYDPIHRKRRVSYTREDKLHVLKFYHESGESKYKICQRFGVPKSSFYHWIDCEDEIKKSREGSKRVGSGRRRRAFWPDAEEKLAAEFKELRQKSRKLMLDACATALPTSSTESSPCTTTSEPIQSSVNDTIPSGSPDGTEVKTRAVPDLIHFPILPNRRLSYTREEKLHILRIYHESGDSKHKICQRFGVPKSSFYRWIECEDEIKRSREGSKRVRAGGRRVFWPDVEEKLAGEFEELRQKSQNLKQDWFRIRAYQLMNELHPDVNFRFSQAWIDRFKARNNIACHQAPKAAQ